MHHSRRAWYFNPMERRLLSATLVPQLGFDLVSTHRRGSVPPNPGFPAQGCFWQQIFGQPRGGLGIWTSAGWHTGSFDGWARPTSPMQLSENRDPLSQNENKESQPETGGSESERCFPDPVEKARILRSQRVRPLGIWLGGNQRVDWCPAAAAEGEGGFHNIMPTGR